MRESFGIIKYADRTSKALIAFAFIPVLMWLLIFAVTPSWDHALELLAVTCTAGLVVLLMHSIVEIKLLRVANALLIAESTPATERYVANLLTFEPGKALSMSEQLDEAERMAQRRAGQKYVR